MLVVPWSLVNKGVVWVTSAFTLGAIIPKQRVALAAAAGSAMMVTAVVSFYGPQVVSDFNSSALWLVLAVVAGLAYGAAGNLWRGGNTFQCFMAVALLGAAFVMEGLWELWYQENGDSIVLFLLVGLTVPLVLGRTWRSRLWGILAVGPLGVLAVIAMFLIGSLPRFGSELLHFWEDLLRDLV